MSTEVFNFQHCQLTAAETVSAGTTCWEHLESSFREFEIRISNNNRDFRISHSSNFLQIFEFQIQMNYSYKFKKYISILWYVIFIFLLKFFYYFNILLYYLNFVSFFSNFLSQIFHVLSPLMSLGDKSLNLILRICLLSCIFQCEPTWMALYCAEVPLRIDSLTPLPREFGLVWRLVYVPDCLQCF